MWSNVLWVEESSWVKIEKKKTQSKLMKSVLNLIKSYNNKATESQVAFLHSLHDLVWKWFTFAVSIFQLPHEKRARYVANRYKKVKI